MSYGNGNTSGWLELPNIAAKLSLTDKNRSYILLGSTIAYLECIRFSFKISTAAAMGSGIIVSMSGPPSGRD
ncbi:golgi apparatus membrane protein tvp23 [Aspergillus luchuensis]|uniref:Golgi apparatus membrane protein tvp23 n=1 Tax=Aspergillus kawachii TaxID=1069201 RepID=A0A146FVW1_ASPKA|nr:golgi apparatus membrane protein tvp23 [Aspergillus luchuensis]